MARYALLDQCARDLGASILLTAHHAGDQYETVLFRLLRGSGIGGLAGMAQRIRRGDLVHLRPFLTLPKAELVACCESFGHPYFNDPSNEDPRYARTRVRRAGILLGDMGFGPEGALRLSRRAGRADAAIERLVADVIAAASIERSASRTLLRRDVMAQAPEEVVLRIVCEEASRLTDRPRPRLEKAETLTIALRRALAADQRFCATLGGAIVRLNRDGLELRKENRDRASSALRGEIPSLSDEGQPPCSRSLVKGG